MNWRIGGFVFDVTKRSLDQWKVYFLFHLLKLRKKNGKNKICGLVVWCHEQDKGIYFSIEIKFFAIKLFIFTKKGTLKVLFIKENEKFFIKIRGFVDSEFENISHASWCLNIHWILSRHYSLLGIGRFKIFSFQGGHRSWFQVRCVRRCTRETD